MCLIGRFDVTENLRESKSCVFSFPDSARTSWKEAKNEAEEPGYHVHCPFPCLQNHSNQAWFVKTTESRQSTTWGGCLPLSPICHPPWLCRFAGSYPMVFENQVNVLTFFLREVHVPSWVSTLQLGAQFKISLCRTHAHVVADSQWQVWYLPMEGV